MSYITTFGKFSTLLFPHIFFCHIPFIPLLCALFSKKLVLCFYSFSFSPSSSSTSMTTSTTTLLLLLVLLFYSLSVPIWVVSIFMFTCSFLSCVKSAGESFFMSVNMFAFPAFSFDSFFFSQFHFSAKVMCTQLLTCPTLWDPMDCSPPDSSVHGVFQAKILEWVAISHSGGPSWPRDGIHLFWVSCIGRWILYHCTTWEAASLSIFSLR